MENVRLFLKRFSPIIAYVGLIVLLAALLSYIISQSLDTLVQALLIAGAVLLILYLVVESKSVRATLSGRGARYGTNAALMIIAFVGIMVMVNALADKHHWRWDLTASKQYSLSEQTINILKGLKDPIKVTGFFSTNNPYQTDSQGQLENLLKSYQLYTDKLSYQFIDPDAKPAAARQYGITSYGTVVFERGDKKQSTTTVDEQSLTSTLLKVTSDQVKAVYFLTGHKEKNPEDGSQLGYSTIKSDLEKQNYKVGTVNFAITDTIPSDMTVLVIAGPQVPFAPKEIDTINKYLDGGGKALIMTEAGATDSINQMLSKWGVQSRDDLIIDPSSSFFGDPTAPLVTAYAFPDVAKGVEGLMTFFPTARSLAKMDNVTTTLTIQPIASSSQTSWGETEYKDAQQVRPDPGKDAMGPLPFAMAVSSSANKARIVVFGDSDFAANGPLQAVQNFGNQDLFAGSVNWLAEEEAMVAIGPKTPDQRPLTLPPGSSRLVVFSSLILLPLVVIVAGISVWWSRR
jgi:ABC-type uncharacterized transport system involved in gliding motility auxiliary subunit